VAATAIKKPDIEKKGILNGYLFFSMPGNLVTHRTMSKDPWLGAISFFILLWVDGHELELCQLGRIGSPGCPEAEIHADHSPTVWTLHFDYPGRGRDFI
jgi:hypothetical protein